MTQHQNLVLDLDGLKLDVRRFAVREALSDHFRIAVWVRVADTSLDLEGFVSGPARFTIAVGRTERTWQGGVSHAELVKVESTGLSTYLVHVVPALWFATQVRNHRIFQHLPLPDIVDKVLEPYRIKPKRELGGKYPDHEYIVQNGETDYDFVCRLLEQAGITYYYRFGKKTELVLNDAPHERPRRGGRPLMYRDQPDPGSEKDYVTKVRLAHSVCPGKVTIRDFDFRKKPDYPLKEGKEVDESTYAWKGEGGKGLNERLQREKGYEQYYYVPGSMLVEKGGTGSAVADDEGVARHLQSEGRAKAERWLGSLRRGQRSVGFTTNALDLSPATVFCIADHPHPELAESSELLVNAFALDGTATGMWVFTGEATFGDDGYQPALATPRPPAFGVQSAVVVGPKGEEIHTDEYGRVRVQFQWDRQGEGISKGKASTKWMRVSQPWAGRRFGVMLVPRIGQEVLVRCFEGDPEQPAVVGRVHNKVQPVPYPLPKHKIKAVWKSDTSPHEDGAYNELRLDDRDGFEQVFMQAERDREQLVRRHEMDRTGINRVTVVGKNRAAIVGNVDATMVGEQYSVQIIKEPSKDDLKILEQKQPTLEPKPTKVAMVDKKIVATTSSATLEMDDAEIILEAKGEISVKAGGMVTIEGGPKVKINC